MPSPFTPEQVKTLLEDEKAGKLPEEVKADLANLRAQKLFPPPLGTGFQRAMRAVKTAVAGPPMEDKPLTPEDLEEDITGALAKDIGRASVDLGRKAAAFLLPSTEIEAGAALATGGGAALASRLGLRALPAALTRIFSAAIGGEAGGQVAGEPAGKGAAIGGAGAALGEAVVAGKDFAARSLPGARARIAREQAAAVGQVAEAASPALGGARTAEDLAKLVKDFDQAKKLAGDNFEQNITWVEQRLQRAMNAQFPGGRRPLDAGPNFGELSEFNPGPVLRVPALSDRPITVREASELMKAPGLAGFGGAKQDPVARTVVGKPSREKWAQGLAQIRQEVNRIDPSGQSWAVLEQSAQDYRVVMALLPLLRSERVFVQTPRGLMFNRAGLQELVFKQWGKLKDRLPAGDLAALQEVLGWTGAWGARDVVPRAGGEALDALRQLARSGGGTGTLAVLGPRTLLPNVGAQYAGPQPSTTGPAIRTMADLLGIATIGRVTSGGNAWLSRFYPF